jgi:hypothetical protein
MQYNPEKQLNLANLLNILNTTYFNHHYKQETKIK